MIENEVKLRSGMLLVVSSTSWMGETIQKFEGSLWNHVGVIVKEGDVWKVCEEGVATGLIYTLLSDYDGKLKMGYHLMVRSIGDLSESQQLMVADICSAYVNRGWYDWAATIIKLPIHYIAKNWFHKELNMIPATKENKSFRCSAWGMFVLNQITKNPWDGHGLFENYNEYDPCDVAITNKLTTEWCSIPNWDNMPHEILDQVTIK